MKNDNYGWIPIDDESLKQYVNKNILVYTDFDIKIAIYTVDDGSHWFSDEFGNFVYNFDEVSHWRPLS